MKKLIIILNLLFFAGYAFGAEKVPLGKWKYKLFINGKETGTAFMSVIKKDDKYISTSEYLMNVSGMKTISRDTIVETVDFKPVRMENYTRVEDNGETSESKIISVFSGRNVKLEIDGKKSDNKIDRDFILDGNFFIHSLLSASLKKNYEISNFVYNPSVELETPVKATAKIVGEESVSVNGKEMKLIHVKQSLENLEDNIDLFIDKAGIPQKEIIQMLNLRIELIISN